MAVTYDVDGDEGSGLAEFFVDGSSIGTSGSGKTSIADKTADFEIGAQDDGSNSFDGKIDDVRVWSDIRTDAEISNNYQQELIGNEAGLVGYWKLNNGLTDETSNNNDLTNNNSVTFSTDVPSWPDIDPAFFGCNF